MFLELGNKTNVKAEVNCTLVQALRLSTGRTANRGSRGIALLFLDHGTRRGLGVSVTPRPLFTPGKDPVPILQKAGWGHRAGLDRCGKSHPTVIRSPDRPARSQSLYLLSYPAHNKTNIRHENWFRKVTVAVQPTNTAQVMSTIHTVDPI